MFQLLKMPRDWRCLLCYETIGNYEELIALV